METFNKKAKRFFGIALISFAIGVVLLAITCYVTASNKRYEQQLSQWQENYYGKFTQKDIDIFQRWVIMHEDNEFIESNDFKTNPLALTDDWGHMLQFNSKEECYAYALQKLNNTITEGQMAEIADDHKDDKLIWIMGEALGRDISVDKSNDLHSSIDTFWNGYGDTWGE